MRHPQQPGPEYYDEQISAIGTEAAPTVAAIESGDFTWRDVAIVIEFLQRYAEVLDEMIDNPPTYSLSDASNEIAACDAIVEKYYG